MATSWKVKLFLLPDSTLTSTNFFNCQLLMAWLHVTHTFFLFICFTGTCVIQFHIDTFFIATLTGNVTRPIYTFSATSFCGTAWACLCFRRNSVNCSINVCRIFTVSWQIKTLSALIGTIPVASNLLRFLFTTPPSWKTFTDFFKGGCQEGGESWSWNSLLSGISHFPIFQISSPRHLLGMESPCGDRLDTTTANP